MIYSYTFNLNNLFEDYVKGNYQAVLDEIDIILKNKETSPTERVEAMFLKSKCYYDLAEYEKREDLFEEGLKIISKAYHLSLELNNPLLEFITSYMNVWFLSKNFKFEEGQRYFNKAEETYVRIKKQYPELSDEIEAFLFILQDLLLILKEWISKEYEWKYEDSMDVLEKALKSYEKSKDSGTILKYELIIIINLRIAFCYNRTGEFDKAIEYLQQALDLSELNNNLYEQANIFQSIGGNYWGKGEYKHFYENIKKSLKIWENMSNSRGMGVANQRLGIYYALIGENKRSIEHSQKAYELLTKDGRDPNSIFISRIFNNMGACFFEMGEIEEALKFYDKAIEINRKKGNEELYQVQIGNKANILKEKGELDKALELHQERYNYFKRRGFKLAECNALKNIAYIYESKGFFKKAFDFNKEVLQIYNDLNNKEEVITSLYDLVLLCIKFDEIELAKSYYNELIQKAEIPEYKITANQILLAEAAILAGSSELRDKIRAEVIYEQLLSEPLSYFVHLGILFHLCELLLIELKIQSDERILDKLKKYVKKITELSSKNNLPLLTVETYWFQAQLSLVELNLDKAKELLLKAQNIAEEKGFNRLTLKIVTAKERMVRQLMELEDPEEHLSLLQRVEKIDLENSLKQITNSQMFQFKQNI